MRYGTTPRADITRPEAESRFPVLLERTLYNKEIGSENAVGAAEHFASRGYVVIIQDVSGRFASEGDFYPFLDDGTGINRDGYDTVEAWLTNRGPMAESGPSEAHTPAQPSAAKPYAARHTFKRCSSASPNQTTTINGCTEAAPSNSDSTWAGHAPARSRTCRISYKTTSSNDTRGFSKALTTRWTTGIVDCPYFHPPT